MKKQDLLLITSLFASTNIYAADIPSYSFIEADFTTIELNDVIKSDGVGVKGAYEISEYAFLEGGFSSTSGRLQSEDTDRDTTIFSFGFGLKQDNPDGLSWFGSYTYNKWQMDETVTREEKSSFGRTEMISESETIDLTANTLRVGFRAQFSEIFELNANISANDIEDHSSTQMGYQIGAVIELSEKLYFVLDYDVILNDFDAEKTTIGIRYSY